MTMSILEPALGRRRHKLTRKRRLRFVTYLAPNLLWFYEFVTRYVGRRLGWPTQLTVGDSYQGLADAADVAFVCGLPYVELVRHLGPVVEPIAAPVLAGERYRGRPIYFSDVIVHHDSPWHCFTDLRGRSWAYNEPHSQSGYGITRDLLVRRGDTAGYFGKVVQAGWHERAVRMVAGGAVDAAAIDSHVLAVLLRDEPDLAGRLRVIDSLGPSTVQPVVAARRLSAGVKRDIAAALTAMADDPSAQPHLARALCQGFVPATDADYADIRAMLTRAEAAGYLTIH
jgi:phosphonate transport system substrate-binding protein